MLTRGLLSALVMVPLRCSLLGPPAPELHEYRLGRTTAYFRDYTNVSPRLCDDQPSWLLEELGSVDDLLTGLGAQGRGGSGFKDSELPLLEEAAATLGPVIDAQRRTVAWARSCPFGRGDGMVDRLTRSEALAKLSADQLVQVSGAASFARQRLKYEQWDLKRQQEQQEAHQLCGKSVAANAVFHAYRDDLGQVRWLFCDGVVVSSLNGAPYQLESPGELAPAEREKRAPEYFLAARMFASVAQPP